MRRQLHVHLQTMAENYGTALRGYPGIVHEGGSKKTEIALQSQAKSARVIWPNSTAQEHTH